MGRRILFQSLLLIQFVLLSFCLTSFALPGEAFQSSLTAPAQLPSELQGLRVFQLPEGLHSRRAGGNPIVMRKLTYQDINLQRLTLGLEIAIKPVDRSATVTKLYYQDVRVNNVPVHIETYDKEFKLSTKELVDLPTPLRVSLVFSEIESLAPIRDLLAQSTLRVTGRSFVVVKLNRQQKLALWTEQVVVPVEFDEHIPADLFPGQSLLGSGLANIMTTLSNPFSTASGNLDREREDKAELARTLDSISQHSICLIYCQYVLRDPNTRKLLTLNEYGTGLVVGSSGKNWRILTARRLVQPWKFDPAIAFLLQHEHLELDPAGYRLAAWTSGSAVLGEDGEPNFDTAVGKGPAALRLAAALAGQSGPFDYQNPDSGVKTTVIVEGPSSNDVAVLDLAGGDFQPVESAIASGEGPSETAGSAPKATLLGVPFALSQSSTKPQPSQVSVSAGAAPPLLKVDHVFCPGEAGAVLVDGEGRILGLCGDASECIPIQTALTVLKQIAHL